MSRKLLWVMVAAVTVAGVAWWLLQGRMAIWRPALTSREIATRVLAEHLAGRFPRASALVVGNPFTLRNGQTPEIYAFENAGVRGLEEGFGSRDRVKVVYPELRADFESVLVDSETTTPLSYLVVENAFDRLVQAHPGFDLLVTLIGVPVHINESRVWRDEKPRFGLLLPDWRMVGGPEAVRDAVVSGKIAAAVVSRPGAPPDDQPVQGKDYRAEFERRFILVTKDNIAELMRMYPRLF